MVKRILDACASDFRVMGSKELLNSIRMSEGRTIAAEIVVASPPLIDGVSNLELAAAFGADLLILNVFDVNQPLIMGLPSKQQLPPIPLAGIGGKLAKTLGLGWTIGEVKELVGRPVGLNLEPAARDADITPGRRATGENAGRAVELGADFIVITGNPAMGISKSGIVQSVREIRAEIADGAVIIAGKMHGAGVQERIAEEDDVKRYIEAGADIVLLPAPSTVPGVTVEKVAALVEIIHDLGALALVATGTSQEGADIETIREIALKCKETGADIHHMGDAGYCGVAVPENITAFSTAIRGRRHTYRRMALSLKR